MIQMMSKGQRNEIFWTKLSLIPFHHTKVAHSLIHSFSLWSCLSFTAHDRINHAEFVKHQTDIVFSDFKHNSVTSVPRSRLDDHGSGLLVHLGLVTTRSRQVDLPVQIGDTLSRNSCRCS